MKRPWISRIYLNKKTIVINNSGIVETHLLQTIVPSSLLQIILRLSNLAKGAVDKLNAAWDLGQHSSERFSLALGQKSSSPHELRMQ